MAERSVSALSCALETGHGGASCLLCVYPGLAPPPRSQMLRGGGGRLSPRMPRGLRLPVAQTSLRGVSVGAPAPPQAVPCAALLLSRALWLPSCPLVGLRTALPSPSLWLPALL